jgi:DNA-binding NarL/FixJ family response regulator
MAQLGCEAVARQLLAPRTRSNSGATEMPVQSVLIVDDHAVVRDGVRNIVSEDFQAVRIGEAATADEAVQLVHDDDWSVAVLDLSLGSRSGLDLIKEFKAIRPQLQILVLSVHAEEQYARRAFKAGAAGYIAKDRPRAELKAAIGRVAEGGRYVSRELAERLLSDLVQSDLRPPHEMLSDREFEVLLLIASGHAVKDIATRLALSDRTVSTYRRRLVEKMGLKTNAELTRYALDHNLVS